MNNDANILDILNTWFKWSKFNPDQTSFNILNNSYDIHRVTELALNVLNDIDTSGVISVLLLKEKYNKILKYTRVNLYDIIANPDSMHAELEMYNYFNADVVKDAEKSLEYTVGRLYENVVGTPLILDDSKEVNIVSSLEEILKDITKLKIDIYKTDGKPIKMQKYSQSIKVFNTLGEAVLTLENSPDGIYTCYINVANSADSYFGVFIKSEGTLISFNDRIDEVYPGQHNVLNRRNGRWSENKSDSIFPYEFILDFSEYCSKGYAMTYKVKDTHTNNSVLFKDFSTTNGFFNLILGLLILKMKYDGKSFTGELTYIESLIGERLGIVTSKNELMVMSGSSIVESNRDVNITFSEDEIKNGIEEFAVSDYAKNLYSLYGQGFKPDYSQILSPINTQHLIEYTGNSSGNVRPEYVGSIDRIRAGAYHLVRQQLGDYIKKNIKDDIEQFGGKEACQKWLKHILVENLDTIILKLAYEYTKIEEKSKEYTHDLYEAWKDGIKVVSSNGDTLIKAFHLPYPPFGNPTVPDSMILNSTMDGRTDKFKCLLGDSVCSVFFKVSFANVNALETFICKRVNAPKFLRIKNNSEYTGNPLLNSVDSVRIITNPVSDSRDAIQLNFALGLSKRNLNKVLKILPNQS